MVVNISNSEDLSVTISPNVNTSDVTLSSGSSSQKKGRKRSYHNKVVVHDIFMKCVDVVKDDTYWKDVFNDAAYGKFLSQPYYVKDGILIYSKGMTVNQLKLSTDPEKAASECIAFFQTTGGYHSRKDILNDKVKRAEFEKAVMNSDKRREWNNFSSSMRKYMIGKYTDQMEKEYDLSKSEKDSLYDLLITGMSIGYMCKATVRMHPTDILILTVDCIEWDDNKRRFYFTKIPKSKQVPVISPQNPIPNTNDIALTREKVNFEESFTKRMSKHFDYSSVKKKKEVNRSLEKANIINIIKNIK